MESMAHVGKDVDKEKIAIAVVNDYESEPRLHRIKTDRRDAVKLAKQRLVHFLLRHEIRCEDAKNWSATY